MKRLWIMALLSALLLGCGREEPVPTIEEAAATPAPTAAPTQTPTPTPLWAEIAGVPVGEDTRELTLNQVPTGAELALLAQLPKLETLDITKAQATAAEISALVAALPQVQVAYGLTLLGVPVGPDTRELTFNNQPIDSQEPFYEVLPLLPRLASLEMCGCGVPNEDMDALRRAFPQAGIVWSIETRHFCVRTDTDHFATWRIYQVDENGKILYAEGINFLTNEDLDFLQYCHDIVALDVGHNKLKNIEFVRSMPKLKYLIISDNPIEDFSPLSGLENLIYLEAFLTHVTDLTPLSKMYSLLDLNLVGTPVTDLSPLYGLKELERLWLSVYGLPNWREVQQQAQAQLPHCQVAVMTDKDSTGQGWRRHPRYAEYRLALGRATP